MMAGGEQQPSTDEVAQFLRYLVGILSSIAPMPPELMARLGSDLKHFQPYIDPHPVADPSVFYRMAGMLCEDPNPTMGQLGRSLSRPLSTVSRMVSQLEERGYAERLRDATDARVVRVALTDVGRQLYEAVSNQAARNAQSVLGSLTREEKVILLTLLAKVAANPNGDAR